MKRLALMIMVLMGSGCAMAPTAEEIAKADYGPSAPADYKVKIEKYFSENLKDPQSVQYKEITVPIKGHAVVANRWAGYSVIYGYRVDATINAKNSYGGYAGFKTYSFLFRDGKIVDVVVP